MRGVPRWPAALLAALAIGLLAGPAVAAVPQTTLADVEDEVMCPICGTLLELSNSPQAQRQKVFIAKLIAAGETKEEIEDALVAQYGEQVLALPEGSGFDLSAYLVPVIAFLVAIAALAVGVNRWRRQAPGAGTEAPAKAPSEPDAERLEADLKRYDL
jgi:cytochrome c-type biogenesis protein CcmH